jgi:hypothetical protein
MANKYYPELNPALAGTLSSLNLPPQFIIVGARSLLQFKQDQADSLSDFLFAVRFAH